MKFSVTVPAYKARFLRECIESILAQTYRDFELIIVNDASPEDLDSIVRSFDDPRIRYYVNERNCGAIDVVDNWNKCLSYATGDYVICMGDDDRLKPCCLEEYARLINLFPGLGIYHGWTEIIDEHSQVVRMQEARPLKESVYSMIWHRWHGRVQYIGDFLFNTQQLRNNGGFYKMPQAWGSDDISAYMAAKDNGIANTQIPVFQYRTNSQTITKTGKSGLKVEAVNQEEEWYKSFLKKEPPQSENLIEHTFWMMLNKELSLSMTKKRLAFIVPDMAEKKMIAKTFFWMRHAKKYRLNIPIVIYAFIEAVKCRIARRNLYL